MSKLSNVRGRITYISSHAKQENLYALYETTDHHYWTELAKCNQQEFLKNGTTGKCIEARELIIALPESFPDLYNPDKLLRLFTDRFKEKYNVECISALHHNKRKTNYHIHLIFSERELLPEPIEKIASRNMFYDEQGKHVRTKKEILDETGKPRKGCKIVKKGEIYESILFNPKNKLFKQENFVDEVKHFYTDLINLLVEDEKEKLHVFDKNGLYLATKKIGKNNPKAERIQTDNKKRMQWNREVDRAIVSGVSETEIRQIKQEYITERIKESIDLFGSKPERFASIITTAVMVLALLISKVLQKARELSARLSEEAPILTPIMRQNPAPIMQPKTIQPKQKEQYTAQPLNTMTQIVSEPKIQMPQEPLKPQIPPKPVMTADAAAYPKLYKIYKELNRQNEIIFNAEKERNSLEGKRDSLKGFAKLTKKDEIQSEIEKVNERIDLLKAGLSGIVKRYGYQNVQDFYRVYHIAKTAYADYMEKQSKWEKNTGTKIRNDNLHDRMQSYHKNNAKQQMEQTAQRKDRGAR